MIWRSFSHHLKRHRVTYQLLVVVSSEMFSPFFAPSSKPVDFKVYCCNVTHKQIHRHLASVPIAAPQDQNRQRTANQTRTPSNETLALTIRTQLLRHRDPRLVAVTLESACCPCGIGDITIFLAWTQGSPENEVTVFEQHGYGALGRHHPLLSTSQSTILRAIIQGTPWQAR